MCFIRKTDETTKVEFGLIVQKLSKNDFQNMVFVASGTRNNQLFLTETVERNIELFEPAYNWFSESVRVFSPQSIGHGIEFRLGDDERFTSFLKELLFAFDPSIRNISSDFMNAELAKGIPQRVLDEIENEIDEDAAVFISNPYDGNRSVVMKKNEELVVLKIRIERRYQGSKDLVSFDLEEESDGTRRLIDLAPLFYELLHSEEPTVAFIDELDRSLHPMATKKLMELFFTRSFSQNVKSQVVTTTHNTVLLDTDLLRKDEIWIIEKPDGASTLTSLQRDFAPRYDRDIRKDYMDGLYGGIPQFR
jgi:AAA15 family ATPase/GTPase